MSFTVTSASNSGTTATVSVTITVPSGNTVAVAILDTNQSTLGTLTDSAGNTYTANASATDGSRVVATYHSLAIPSGITSVSYSSTGTSNTRFVMVWNVSATGTISKADAKAVFFNFSAPNTTDGVTTGSLALTSSDGLLVGYAASFFSTALVAGTGFTSDGTFAANGSLFEHKAVAASGAVTWTSSSSGDYILCSGLALQIASVTPSTLAWQSIRPLNPPGASPSRFGRFNQLPRGYLSTAQTSGASALTFAQTGALTGTGALVGSSALVFGQSGAATGAGAMTAASALVFNQTGTLTGAGSLAGESDLVFGQTGTLSQPGLSGSASIVFGQTGSLTAAGVLAGSSALQFGQTASLVGAGALAASSALTIGETGNLAALGVLAGTTALLFAQTATLTASGALAGSSALTFAASATADLPAGTLAGTSALSFGGSATLSAFGELVGNCQIIFDASANTAQANVQPGPVDSPRIAEGYYRRKKKLRKIESAEPVFIAPASLERLPQAVIDRVPDFTTLAQTLGEQPALLSARIDTEIAHLMQIADERDDEEALEWILKSID